ncbi:MAG: hypothetical protein U1C33_04170, partial [Candidatus Cloacimonadaceae bacterium]|nr:hypothetical protein [Candidatus Cloacimonadaceae bacterium]
ADLKTIGNGFFTNYGYVCITASIGCSNITFVNQEDATFVFGAGSGVWHTGGGAGPTTFTNNGILRKTGNSISSLYKLNTTNNGTIEVQEGTLKYDTSSFNNNSQVNVLSGTLNLHSSSGSGAGNYYLADNTVLLLSNNHALTCQDGVQIQGTGEIQLVSSGGLYTGGSIDGLSIAETIHIYQTGGKLGGSGRLNFNGTHIWTGGDTSVGNYYLGEDGLLIVSTTDTKRLTNGSFHNYGTVQVSGSLGAGSLNFYNYAGAELQIQGSFSMWHTGGGSAYPSLHNNGLIRKNGEETATFDVMYLNNYANLVLEQGTLTFYCAGSAHYNQAGSGARYHLAGKMVFRYGNLSTNHVGITLDGPLAEIRDHNNNNILASCTGTSASGSFT